ncbi:hypothetical protein J6590_093852 [Homalodisca vitripennis]|nr:hypothetical protein J6590_093852 [Homalodisca vitripennis]
MIHFDIRTPNLQTVAQSSCTTMLTDTIPNHGGATESSTLNATMFSSSPPSYYVQHLKSDAVADFTPDIPSGDCGGQVTLAFLEIMLPQTNASVLPLTDWQCVRWLHPVETRFAEFQYLEKHEAVEQKMSPAYECNLTFRCDSYSGTITILKEVRLNYPSTRHCTPYSNFKCFYQIIFL